MAFKKGSGNKKDEFQFEILKTYGTIGTENNGWIKKLTYTSFNGNDPKYDIRPWKETENGLKMGKGIGLDGQEAEDLMKLLQQIADEAEEE